MQIFDPHIHCFSRTTDDYERMRDAGIRIVNEPAFWLGQPRTSVGSFKDYFDTLLGWERFRAAQYGILHVCTLSLNPKEANDDRVNDAVLELLPDYLEKESVVGVGEIGFDEMTAKEDKYFRAQLALAKEHGLVALIHTPHRDKKKGVERTIDLVLEMDLNHDLVIIDHNTEETIPMVKDRTYCWAGHTIYPQTKLSPERATKIIQEFGTDRMLINSSADWGESDPLNVPIAVANMRRAGLSELEIEKVVWRNPVEFFAQSGRLDLALLDALDAPDKSGFFAGNTVLRR
jgi:predicted metal-dependent TIM-barrel fold hydrolase